MKKNSIFKVILLTILCVAVCTWIFPTAQFNGQLTVIKKFDEKALVGIFDLGSYVLDLFRYFPYILVTTLSIGAFYGVAYRIPAYRVLLDTIVEKFKGKESIFLVTIIVLVSAIVSVTGLSFGMLFVFPFIISVILLMGYNKLVAASTTVGSVMVGLIGTTVGTKSVDYINYLLNVKTTDQMVVKVILLLVGMVLLSLHVISYSKKTKNDTDRVLEFVPGGADMTKPIKVVKDEVKEVEVKTTTKKKTTASKTTTKKTTTKKKAPAKKTTKTKANDAASSSVKVVKNKKVSIIPFIVIFDLVLILIAVGSFDWTGIVSAKWPADALKAVRDFKIGGFPILAKLIGSETSLNAFGSWSLNVEVPMMIMLATCIMAFIYGVKFDKFIEGIVDGIRKAFVPAFFMFIAYMVLIIATYHPFQLNITKFFLDITGGLNVITMTIIAFFASLFNVETIYTAQSTLPYVSSVITKTGDLKIIAVIFQAVYGLAMLIVPTSAVLIGTLAYLEIPYTQWIKHIWKLFLELLAVLVVIFFIMTLL